MRSYYLQNSRFSDSRENSAFCRWRVSPSEDNLVFGYILKVRRLTVHIDFNGDQKPLAPTWYLLVKPGAEYSTMYRLPHEVSQSEPVAVQACNASPYQCNSGKRCHTSPMAFPMASMIYRFIGLVFQQHARYVHTFWSQLGFFRLRSLLSNLVPHLLQQVLQHGANTNLPPLSGALRVATA